MIDASQTEDPEPHHDSHASWTQRLLVGLSTGLGLGKVSKAPGTLGSLWGIPLVFGLQAISGHWGFMLASWVLLFLIGIPISNAGIRYFHAKDPKHVVFDEIAAFPVIFLLVPLTWTTAIAGFLLFRIFDVGKPWPIRRFERLPGAWGVMSDDTVAGIYAAIILTILWSLILSS